MDGNIQPGLDGLSSRNKESELGKAAQAGGGFAGTGGVGGRYSEAGQDQMEMLLAPAVKTPHTRQQCVSDERLQSWCHPEGRPPQCRVQEALCQYQEGRMREAQWWGRGC